MITSPIVLKPNIPEELRDKLINKTKSNTTITEQSKLKRQALTNFMINNNSNKEDFNSIITQFDNTVPYTVKESIEWSTNDINKFNKIESQFNHNHSLFYNKMIAPYILEDLKLNNNNEDIKFINKSTYIKNDNPYIDEGISNKEFKEIWNTLKHKYPTLKDSDIKLCADNFTIEELKYEIGYNTDQTKVKLNKEDKDMIPTIDLSIPKTKGKLYSYWINLKSLHNLPFGIIGDINHEQVNQSLSDIEFIIFDVLPNRLDKDLMFTGSKRIRARYNMLMEVLNIDDSKCIGLNIGNTTEDLYNGYKVFEKLLEVLSKGRKHRYLLPITEEAYKFITIKNNNNNIIEDKFYLYKNLYLYPALLDKDKFESFITFYKEPNKKNYKLNKIEDITIDEDYYITKAVEQYILNIDNKAPVKSIAISKSNTIKPNTNTSTYSEDNALTYDELARDILPNLKEYNIVYCSKKVMDFKGYCNKISTPYIIFRKGLDKRLYYLNPTIIIGYRIGLDSKAEEPFERLNIIDNVSYSKRNKIIDDIKKNYSNSNTELTFYNTDFVISTYVNSYIRNRLNYKEGNNSPRVLVLDFETELSAIKVKGDSEVIDAKCRLVSLFDLYEKVFYCAGLKDPKYHTDEDLKDITEHDGYKVNITYFDNEIDIWNWLNTKLIELDPDILTGWNVERFDLTYAIVRCKTLGLSFRSKYSEFKVAKTFDNSGYMVMVDGIVILDYQKLYRFCQLSKRENYKLDYICNVELKKGKRKMIVDNHDEMYYHHFYEYILYNLEDVERIMELENKLNYIKFQFEMCNVSNISWDDIFFKSRLVDGLVYNHAWDVNHTLIKAKPKSSNNENTEDEEANVSNLLQRMNTELQRFMIATDHQIPTVSNINISEYIQNTIIDTKGKGYKGAIVLEPLTGVKDLVADLDASQMYPRLMIRSNIFVDTLCANIAIDNERLAELWLYDRDNFPDDILITYRNTNTPKTEVLTKSQFQEFLNDKILTPFGTIYWKPKYNRSLISNILIELIANRSKYKKMRDEVTGQYSDLKSKDILTEEDNNKLIEYNKLIERYDNLQMAYKQLINSFYGVMGLQTYRLSDSYSAASITASGRELTRMVAYYTSKYMEAMTKYKSIDTPFDSAPITEKTLIGMENKESRPFVIYGDTDSVFVHIKKIVDAIYGTDLSVDKQIEYAWIIIERISEYVNNYVIKDILERKGIDFNDEDSKFNYEYKKELIMSKVLFGTQKKCYASHIVYKEGKKLDKIDIKGMLAIKSDNAKFSRDLASDVINFILKDYDPNNVVESNKQLRELYDTAVKNATILCENGGLDVGRPISMVQSALSYSTIQAGIRGMLIYDILFGHEFQSGDKGYQYYLKSINWDQLSMNKEEFEELFNKKYMNAKWFDETMKNKIKLETERNKRLASGKKLTKALENDLFYSSITIPTDLEKFPTHIFTIDIPTTIESVVKSKVSSLYSLVGINVLDKEDELKLRKSLSAVRGIDLNAFNSKPNTVDPVLFSV